MKQPLTSWLLMICCLMLPWSVRAQQSSNVTVSSIQTPALTPCSGQGTFILRLTNISASPISNIVIRDSMPPGISYVTGSVSGTNVTFGSTIASNVVTFNVSSLPASGTVDISFTAAASCSVSNVAANISNTYKVSWSTFFAAPLQTSNYSILFPSLSITPGSTGTYNASCLTPFVRDITICNGGFGSVDSVTFTDAESNSSLVVQGFSNGVTTGLGTNNAKTVLKAADFATVGNHDGKLDQNECIVLHDTMMVVGSTSPIAGTLTANWGCNGSNCSNPTSNSTTLNTTINAASPLAPALTRTLSVLSPPDSPNHIYDRPVTYMEVVKNNSSVTAQSAFIRPSVYGLRYINTDSIWASKNGGARFHPVFSSTGGSPYWNTGTPADYANSLTPFANSSKPNNALISLGNLLPGDSVVVTFEVRTAGPLSRINVSIFDHCFSEASCGACYRALYGPAISGAVDANMSWQGCPSGTYNSCALSFQQKLFNGTSAALINEYNPVSGYGNMIGRFNGYSGFTDSTNLDGRRCAYFDNDTLRILMHVDNLDLPFYTNKSQFYIKIYTNGGSKWDGNLARTFGRITSWSAAPWYADHVVDSSAIDSTIRVYFRRGNCPIPDFTTKDASNSYGGGGWDLNIGFVNTCPGSAQKRVYMTRVYTIDTTSGEPAIESGTNTFPSNYTWNSKCAGPCADGVSVLAYNQARTTFGAPDNNQDGLPDATGTIDMTKVKTNMITWGDTMQLKFQLVVHTTNPGGVPSLYVNSSINYSPTSNAIICNGFLNKDFPKITLIRPGVGTFTGTSSSIPVSTNNFFLSNLSLQGTGGVTIPGVTTYQEGDTVIMTENIFYNEAHGGWGDITWSFLHVPYTATVINPTAAQQIKCDSVICNFHTVDFDVASNTSRITANSCSDSVTFRWGIRTQVSGSGCGTNYFPYESRNIYTPASIKINIPAASNFTFRSVKLYWTRIITGSGNQCGTPINGVTLTPGQYNLVGDTLYLDFRQLVSAFGLDFTQNNMYSIFQVDVTVKYNLAAAGCTKDHLSPGYTFPVVYRCITSRPMDTTINPTNYNGTGSSVNSAVLGWAGANANTPVLYAGSTITVTQNKVIVPVRYTVNNNTGLNTNCWMAIPGTAGVSVDSVKEHATGILVPQTPAGSNIYQLGTVGGNGATKDYDVYTHVILCNNGSLTIYTDRTPCTGYPASWASYACQANAQQSTFNYVTFAGELQMVDSLFSTSKDICTNDTVQFKVVNSQTQTANTLRVSFTLPTAMSLVSGATYLKYGTGSFALTQDPVYNAGIYTWTQPVGDTLAPINTAPNNLMYLQVALTTDCGFTSGSQIKSAINGNVACGAISSLYNTNPPALNINGAPSLSYFTNPQATIEQLSSCGTSNDKNIYVVLHISGGATRTGDTVKATLPKGYYFTSYNAAATGAHNAPSAQPIQTLMPDSTTVLSWSYPGGVAAGDSIVFSFRYNEINRSNKCTPNPTRLGYLSTYISSGVFCVKTGGTCAVSIANGTDTSVQFQTQRPTLSTRIDSVFYGPGAAPTSQRIYASQLHIRGVIKNAGPAAVPAGTPIDMETFIDVDNNGVISAGDTQYNSYIYTGGLAAGDSVTFDFLDTTSHRYCLPCYQKNVLIRFADLPSQPSGMSQCLCDSVTAVMQPQALVVLPLSLSIDDFSITQKNCNTAVVHWRNLETPAPGEAYSIELSNDGYRFNSVQMIPAVDPAGTAYTRNVALPSGISYIRLTQMLSNRTVYSPVSMLQNTCGGAKDEFSVYPNPYYDNIPLIVKVQEITAGVIHLEEVNAAGVVLRTLDKNVTAGNTEFEFPGFGDLPPGNYIIRAVHADGNFDSQKIVKK
ncbi:T9SS type A sorting domain-containing protein [Taibaiella soli]|uniref:Secretion system C-terminal sorting domain-containing protein n=1 Tax=Taibaiella soli TaxID=1649169 RepID=A0A2W2AA17_9BACT|nr:T9SS type A sorting domain-containing protein [Taibaiella soli]PZF72131.1 hypothetical protein DN068_14445 [Taibaiella soli]